jgi:hypothetical protein
MAINVLQTILRPSNTRVHGDHHPITAVYCWHSAVSITLLVLFILVIIHLILVLTASHPPLQCWIGWVGSSHSPRVVTRSAYSVKQALVPRVTPRETIIFFLLLFLFLFGRFDVVAIIIHHHRHRQRSDRLSISHITRRRLRPSIPLPFSVARHIRLSMSILFFIASYIHSFFGEYNSFRPTRPWTSCHHAAAARDSTCKGNWYIFTHSWCEDVYSLVLGSLRHHIHIAHSACPVNVTCAP